MMTIMAAAILIVGRRAVQRDRARRAARIDLLRRELAQREKRRRL